MRPWLISWTTGYSYDVHWSLQGHRKAHHMTAGQYYWPAAAIYKLNMATLQQLMCLRMWISSVFISITQQSIRGVSAFVISLQIIYNQTKVTIRHPRSSLEACSFLPVTWPLQHSHMGSRARDYCQSKPLWFTSNLAQSEKNMLFMTPTYSQTPTHRHAHTYSAQRQTHTCIYTSPQKHVSTFTWYSSLRQTLHNIFQP